MSVPVIVLDDERLIREGEEAVAAYNNDIKNARSRIIPMARGLLAARRRYPANRDFGEWLKVSPYGDVGDTDRAALIQIGEHDEFAAKFVRTTNLISPQTIWNAIEELLPSSYLRKTPPLQIKSDANDADEAPASVSDDPEIGKKPVPQSRPSHKVIGSGGNAAKHLGKLKLVTLGYPLEDLIKVLETYPRKRQAAIKSTLTDMATARGKNAYQKSIAKQLFARALAIVESGCAPQLSDTFNIDARMFFANLPEAWCKHLSVSDVSKSFDRFVQADSRAAELLATNVPMNDIFRELYHLVQTGKALPIKPPIAFPAGSKIKHEVKYCGVTIWPGSGLDHVSYDDLKAGWHLADHWLKTIEVATPQKPNEVLTAVMHLLQDIKAASSINGLCDVMDACIAAYAKRNGRKEKADFIGGTPPGLPR
jgi:hypothetical protein